jgi:hypothetical protein
MRNRTSLVAVVVDAMVLTIGLRSADAQQRGQDVQAPRSQDVQAPRNVAKGRGAALTNARTLVNEAEAACKDADAERPTA